MGGRRQAIIWAIIRILLIGPIGTNFSEILIKIHTFPFKKMHLKVSFVKWRPFCLGFNVLTPWGLVAVCSILVIMVSEKGMCRHQAISRISCNHFHKLQELCLFEEIFKYNPSDYFFSQIFTEDMPEVEQLPREKILDYLEKNCKELVIPYLVSSFWIFWVIRLCSWIKIWSSLWPEFELITIIWTSNQWLSARLQDLHC